MGESSHWIWFSQKSAGITLARGFIAESQSTSPAGVPPKFAVLINGWIEELLTNGRVELAVPTQALAAINARMDRQDELISKLIALAERQSEERSLVQNVSTGPKWTIELRLYELRWDGTTAKQRKEICRIANEMLDTVRGEEAEYKFGRYFYSRDQLDILDRAIGVVKRKAELAARKQADRGLFDEAV